MPAFDVFLSHNSVDKAWVSQLKDDLRRYGLKVWLDKDEIPPGDLFAKALEQGLEDSQAVALIISPAAMASGWVEKEYYRALSLTNQALRLVPVILRQAEVPGFIQSYNWVDFRDEGQYAQNVWKLVWGITGRKPAKALDLTGPLTPPPITTAPTPSAQPATPPPSETTAPAQPAPVSHGGISVGGNLTAENIVTSGGWPANQHSIRRPGNPNRQQRPGHGRYIVRR